jgi:hypothetical protein
MRIVVDDDDDDDVRGIDRLDGCRRRKLSPEQRCSSA